jgi:hypothetical protein
LNKYSYTINNPLKYTDPTGRSLSPSEAKDFTPEYYQNFGSSSTIIHALCLWAYTQMWNTGSVAGVATITPDYYTSQSLISPITEPMTMYVIKEGSWADRWLLDWFSNGTIGKSLYPLGIFVSGDVGTDYKNLVIIPHEGFHLNEQSNDPVGWYVEYLMQWSIYMQVWGPNTALEWMPIENRAYTFAQQHTVGQNLPNPWWVNVGNAISDCWNPPNNYFSLFP